VAWGIRVFNLEPDMLVFGRHIHVVDLDAMDEKIGGHREDGQGCR